MFLVSGCHGASKNKERESTHVVTTKLFTVDREFSVWGEGRGYPPVGFTSSDIV